MKNAYEAEISRQQPKPHWRRFVEPAILLLAIIGYCALMANRESDENNTRMTEAEQDEARACASKPRDVLDFRCEAINDYYAENSH